MLENFSFPQLQLANIDFEKTGNFFDRLVHKLEDICKNTGKGAIFQQRKTELRNTALAGYSVRAIMNNPGYIRPLIDLWMSDNTFCRAAPPGSELLGHIEYLVDSTARHRLTRLALRELCVLFFVRYTDLPGAGLIGEMLVRQLALYNPPELMYGLDKLMSCQQLLNENGHKYLASYALHSRYDVIDIARRYGIPTDNSCFVRRSLQAYYVAKLEELPVNARDAILEEVRKRELCMQYVDEYFRLGHMVMLTLINKLIAAQQTPCELWMDTILAIGGDPRVPQAASGIWWGELQKHHRQAIQAMLEWLSAMDLRIFLQICRDYVAGSDREDMARMYPARELFLKGLFKKKVIRRTRLFLGYNVQRFVAQSLEGKKAPYSTRISDAPDLAVFYLDLGNAHIVEGTFSFTMKIMDRIPPKSVLATYQDQVHSSKLRRDLERQYEEAFPRNGRLTCCRHDPRGKWKLKAVQGLQSLGISIVDSDVISQEEFRRMW